MSQSSLRENTINLWPEGRMPGLATEEAERVRPDTGDGVVRLTNVSRPQLTIYPCANAHAPAVIVCPGGGYEILAYNKEGIEVAQWLNSIGLTALVLKYRVPQNREGARQDLQRAIRLVRAHSSQWNIYPQTIGVLGFSAGGHLCARLSTAANAAYEPIDAADAQPTRPDFAVLVYPAYLAVDGRLALEFAIDASVPPTLIVHARDDHAYFPGSPIYFAALQRAGVSSELKVYNSGGHGHGLRSTDAVSAWPNDCEKWIKQNGFFSEHRRGVGASSTQQ